mmetsp:Transcript_616/g.1481  ORF Transcript_616/g.1481 Transcript_616/m.1481 type:complete len:400 (-) Transcript_616:175-1374(-)
MKHHTAQTGATAVASEAVDSGEVLERLTLPKLKAGEAGKHNVGTDSQNLDPEDSLETPGFEGVDDLVFLDGLEEVVPEGGNEEEGESEAEGGSGGGMDVLMPLDVPQVAVTAGHIRTPHRSSSSRAEVSPGSDGEGPSFHDPEDAFFHDGVEEVVADWRAEDPEQADSEADSALSELAIRDANEQGSTVIRDTFFLDGLEEVATPAEEADMVGYMPPVDVPPLPAEECPSRICTGDRRSPREEEGPGCEPSWSEEADAFFLVHGGAEQQDQTGGACSNGAGPSASALDLPLQRRLSLPRRDRRAAASAEAGAAGPDGSSESSEEGLGPGERAERRAPSGVPNSRAAGGDGGSITGSEDALPWPPHTGTPNNTPIDSGCTNSPKSVRPSRHGSGILSADA